MTRFTTITLVLKVARKKISDEEGLIEPIEALWERDDPLVLQGCTTGIKRLEGARTDLDEAIYQLRRLRDDFQTKQVVE